MATDTKKIAKNTLFMYLRLIITIPLAFITSRIVLQQLGVDDYGIYNVVGGVISFFSILRSSFASATQRFYNVSMATENKSGLSSLFTTSFIVHLCLAVALAVIIEGIGTWFIQYKMNYPEGRENDVFFCLHTAVVGMIFSIINIPFDAMVIAKEKMAFYSYITIFDVFFKLALVSILIFVHYEKLKLYALFQMVVPLLVFILTLGYFKRNFLDVRVTRMDTESLRSMSRFAIWGLFGNVGASLSNQGTNLLLNVFGGVAVNAAQGLALQVRSVISRILTDSIIAVRPQATQLFAKGNFIEFYNLISTYTKILFSLAVIICLPIIIYVKPILILWLDEIPEYLPGFIILLMLYSIIRSYHEPLDIIFKASARMKEYQLVSSFFMCSNFGISWIVLAKGYGMYSVFVVMIINEILLWGALARLSVKDGMNIKSYLVHGVLPAVLYSVICLLIAYVINIFNFNFIIGSVYSILLTTVVAFFIILSNSQRTLIIAKLKHKFHGS